MNSRPMCTRRRGMGRLSVMSTDACNLSLIAAQGLLRRALWKCREICRGHESVAPGMESLLLPTPHNFGKTLKPAGDDGTIAMSRPRPRARDVEVLDGCRVADAG